MPCSSCDENEIEIATCDDCWIHDRHFIFSYYYDDSKRKILGCKKCVTKGDFIPNVISEISTTYDGVTELQLQKENVLLAVKILPICDLYESIIYKEIASMAVLMALSYKNEPLCEEAKTRGFTCACDSCLDNIQEDYLAAIQTLNS